MTSAQQQSIAIIGMGCRFPGGVDSPESLWSLLSDGGDAIIDVPKDRWSTDRFYSEDTTVPGKTIVRRAGFLRDPVNTFDPLFFGISPREAQHMDPQQRLLLEVGWESMENAGLVPADLAGSKTGVYVGGFALDAMTILMSPLGRKLLDTHHAATAASMTMLAARLSYVFDFRGPSVTMDTACSSSLVALHYACQGLLAGECDLALAGGVNVMLSAEYPIIMSKGHFLARDGHCKSFDAKADGYSRGEGCGIVLLKRLDEALRDGDRIHAVVCGTGVNQDGRTDGITVPSSEAQEALIRRVYDQAGVKLNAVRYVEAHGTGTPVGDPLEAAALGRTMGADRDGIEPLIIGSVKANIGHLEAAAGVAGLIKACLCLRHGEVPRQIHLDEPNPAIPFADLGLRLPLEPLKIASLDGDPLYVGVNSFGYGGTNAHAILRAAAPSEARTAAGADGTCLLPISARSEGALRLMAQAWAETLESPEGPGSRSLAASASQHRSQFDHRLAVGGASRDELAKRLRAYLGAGAAEGVTVGRSRTHRQPGAVFVFSGMGPQWWGMGQGLYATEPVFRASAEAVDRAFQAVAGWSILDEMLAPEARSRMGETCVAQPANFLLQVGLAAVFKDLGIEPAAIVGHSVGEVAAAYVAGALDLADAVRVVYHRSRLQQTTAGTGTMLAVGLGVADVAPWVKGHESAVSIGAVNSARSVTLAGDETVLKLIAEGLAEAGLFHRFLKVEVPYHSPMMEPLRDELLASLDGLRCRSPSIPLISTVTGRRFTEADRHDGPYWYRNLRDPVLFADALDALIDEGYGVFAEIGPNPVLSSSIREGLTDRNASGDIVYSLRRKDLESPRILATIAELYSLGLPPEWRRINGEADRDIDVPTYHWDRDTFWSESVEGRADRLGAQVHPLLGAPVPLATGATWTAELNANYLPWLGDHCIEGTTIFPGAAYVEACLSIHAEAEATEPAIVEHLDLAQAMMLNPAAGHELQWSFDAKTRTCTAASRAYGSDGAWQANASAAVLASIPWPAAPRDLAALEARCPETIDVAWLYRALASRGLEYGPAFQCVRALRRGTDEVVARLALGEAEAAAVDAYRVHPAMLDAAFQALIAACGDGGTEPTLFMPVHIRQVLYHAPVGATAYAHCRLVRQTAEAIEGDVVLFAADGTVTLDVKGIRCLAVGRRQADAGIPLDRWMYQYAWDLAEPAVGFADAARWIVFTDDGAVGTSLVKNLRHQGAEAVIEVTAGECFRRLADDRYEIRRESAADMVAVLAEARAEQCRGIVHLWAATPASDDAGADPTGLKLLGDAMTLVQALAAAPAGAQRPRLYVATCDAQHVEEGHAITGLNQAALVGFLRVVAIEQPDLRATLVDLDAAMVPAAAGRRLGQEILADSPEDDVALRGTRRFVHRLRRRPEPRSGDDLVAIKDLEHDPAYALEITVPGSLEKVRYQELPRRAPVENEIELRIRAVGLNFKDVLKVLGLLSKQDLVGTHCGQTLGMEASAVVTAVGPGVTGFAVGDELITLVAGCLGSHITVRTDQLLALPRPSTISPTEAATIPVTFMTAYYALNEAARLRRGETVLIHAGAGGVGMAAIQVARWLGATIFATAGSPEKRALLLDLGVAQVWDSRSLEFVDGIREATQGRGVDVVLNSLSGEAMERSFEALAPLGRFVEIGKRDILEKNRLPMAAFDRSVSFCSLDLDRLTLTRGDVILRLFGETFERFAAGDFVPLPLTRFPAAKASEALRFMAQAKQIGKVVVDFDDAADVVISPLATLRSTIRADATYLVTGAFGGVGIEMVRMLAGRGARHFVLTGRSGASSDAARTLLDDLRQDGIVVREARVDVADAAAVRSLLDDMEGTMPRLAGVFHAAAVLDDALIPNLDAERVALVMNPKALGALVLDAATRHLALDHFVLFSSATSLIGNPGQGSYVAANVVLDTLARQRRAQGLAGTAINWGAIGEVGMLAQDNAATRQLDLAGVHRIPVGHAMQALSRLLDLDPGIVAVMDVDWSAWLSLFSTAKTIPRFASLAAEASELDASSDYQTALLSLPTADWLPLLTASMLGIVAEALHVPVEKIDRHQPLSELGIDSLVGVELQSAIGAKLGLQISILQLMKGGNIEEMAAVLLQKMTSGGSPQVPKAAVARVEAGATEKAAVPTEAGLADTEPLAA